jgi:RNA polymerase sigma-70 factor (ECF subfamily)
VENVSPVSEQPRHTEVPCIPGCSNPDDEPALIEAARHDPVAFGPLYQRYVDRIYHYLYMRAGNAEDAADLTQQVFLQAWRALPRYEARGAPFAAWLLRIARNVAIDAGRRRPMTIDWDYAATAFEHAAEREQDPEALLLRREAFARLGAVLRRLDPDKRELLVLRFVVGLTVREIAPVVGKSEAAVHKQFARILQDLKRRYKEHGYEE